MTEGTQGSPSFTELGLCDEVTRAVVDAGYTVPTPIQAKAIPHILKKQDLVGIAQTGTGKTAAFVLPIIHHLTHGRARARMPRSVILSPTRELASQTADNFTKYGKHVKLTMALIIGGVGMGEQEKLLDRGVDVLIATPGRLLDWFERGKVLLGGVSVFVIDEADRMLDMGFIPDVERIAKLIARREQTMLFSATMPKEVRRLADQFLKDPVEVQVARPATMASNIEARLVKVAPDKKTDALERLFRAHGVDKAIIFCNRKRDVGTVTRKLQRKGYNARDIHGDLDQSQRQATLDAFKADSVDYLVATDVAARGLDISDMPVVINLDVPSHADDYVHRIGRTGRAGRKGRAFTFATDDDARRLAKIEKLVGGAIPVFDPFAAVAQAAEEAPAAEPRPSAATAAPATPEVAAAEQETPPAGGEKPKRRRGPKKAAAKAAPGEKAPGEATPDKAAKSTDQAAADAAPAERRDGKGAGKDGERRSRRKREPEPAPAEPVVGLGDHVPSFLLKPVPVRPENSGKGE
ncbi:MAG: DEAD/DEAH box helicase [Alphaproteobacteria bacterium]|nr:DEAD/DEAH box helicase [Alphaproteobacteria bacterium]